MKFFMKLLLIVFSTSLTFSQSHEMIPFDWSGQFGYVNLNGTIFWNQDWSAKNLLFDGTWAIYPPMFGPEIEKDFNNNKKDSIDFKKESDISSFFKYDQGDYALDNLSLGIDYITQRRFVSLHGFKRTYSGTYNQYYNGSYQPIHQTYLISYLSSNDIDYSGLTLGHFNTYSGFPDGDTIIGSFDNRITNLNMFWERIFSDFKIKFNIDQFLQRYKVEHSLSYSLSPRFLTRNQFQFEMIYNKGSHSNLAFGVNSNNRNIRIDDYFFKFYWNKNFVKYSSKSISIYADIIPHNNKYYSSYVLEFDKTFANFQLYLNQSSTFNPIHPYYIFNNINAGDLQPFMKKNYRFGKLTWNKKNHQFSADISQVIDDDKFWNTVRISDDKTKNTYSQSNLNYETNIGSNFEIIFNYMMQEKNNIYSGGIGKIMGMKLRSYFNLFEGFLNLNINGEIKHLGDRSNNSFINPIEMVPIENNFENTIISNPVNIINTSIEAKVATFSIRYEWINIAEIILGSLNSDSHNYFAIHPQMPDLGRQMNLSIEWYFQD